MQLASNAPNCAPGSRPLHWTLPPRKKNKQLTQNCRAAEDPLPGSFVQISVYRDVYTSINRRGGYYPPGQFVYKLTSPKAIIIYFPSENPKIASNFGRAANSRPYNSVFDNCSINSNLTCETAALGSGGLMVLEGLPFLAGE